MTEVYKTCLFKIHNPSKRRRAMMLDCLRRNERAYWKVLDAVKSDAEEDALLAKQIKDANDAFKIEFKQRKQAKLPRESVKELHWKQQVGSIFQNQSPTDELCRKDTKKSGKMEIEHQLSLLSLLDDFQTNQPALYYPKR